MITWRDNEYQKAKEAITPGGPGLGRRFIAHFMPHGSVPSAETLQNVIETYYNERWEQEGRPLLDAVQFELWKAKDANDQEGIAAALEKEK